MSFKNRPRLIANTSCSTKLFTDDLRELARLAELEKRTASDILRELAHEALRTRRLRAIGRDEAADFYRQLYRELLQEGLQPMLAQLGQLHTSLQETLPVAATPSGGLVEAKRDRSDDRWQRAHFALSVQLLRHLLATENFGRVLTTIGMQRDQLSEAEVQAQLAVSDTAAGRDAQQILQQLLAEYRLINAPTGAENHPPTGA